MTAQHPGDCLHRLDPRAHHLHAPLIEERPGPIDRSVVPEVVEPFPQQHGPDGPQVVLHEPRRSPLASDVIDELVLGGEGWTLRSFYVGGGPKSHLIDADKVNILTLEAFVALVNRAPGGRGWGCPAGTARDGQRIR